MTCTSKTRITICERGFFKPNAIQGHFLSHLKVKMSHASWKSVTRRPEANFGWYKLAWHVEPPNLSLHLTISTIPLMWATAKVYHIQDRGLIVFPSPTQTHEKLNCLSWEIILNATTWLASTTVHQSRVVIFLYSAFEIALLCAHLLNQNLSLPYRNTVLHPKHSLHACLLVYVMLLLM
jgi:hypothetical protein